MRLIDADKLQKAIPAEEDNITGMGMTYDEMEAYNDGIDEQWKKIVNAPTIEPERPKGYMKIEVNIIGDEDVVCETCGAYCFSTSYKFCPKCGVEFIGVRGEQDE